MKFDNFFLGFILCLIKRMIYDKSPPKKSFKTKMILIAAIIFINFVAIWGHSNNDDTEKKQNLKSNILKIKLH